MNLTNKLSNSARNTFFIIAILFVFFLHYIVIQAQKISDNWQNINEQALETAITGK